MGKAPARLLRNGRRLAAHERREGLAQHAPPAGGDLGVWLVKTCDVHVVLRTRGAEVRCSIERCTAAFVVVKTSTTRHHSARTLNRLAIKRL
jgi:hypothetical protein